MIDNERTETRTTTERTTKAVVSRASDLESNRDPNFSGQNDDRITTDTSLRESSPIECKHDMSKSGEMEWIFEEGRDSQIVEEVCTMTVYERNNKADLNDEHSHASSILSDVSIPIFILIRPGPPEIPDDEPMLQSCGISPVKHRRYAWIDILGKFKQFGFGRRCKNGALCMDDEEARFQTFIDL